jgi:hypothetical protein
VVLREREEEMVLQGEIGGGGYTPAMVETSRKTREARGQTRDDRACLVIASTKKIASNTASVLKVGMCAWTGMATGEEKEW